MYIMRDFFSFFVGLTVTTSCFILLLPHALCPFGVLPAEQELALGNRVQADPSMKKLDTAATSADDNLKELLRATAMDDKTVIMTFTNEAWAAPGSLQDLFLESFRLDVGTLPLLKHLVIVSVDVKGYEQCQRVHPFCYHFRVEEGDSVYAAEQVYMSKGYLEMMRHRNRFQLQVLELGYSFIFTDMDLIWLRNPLLRVPIAADIAISSDNYSGNNPYDLNKMANTGFMYVKASAGTVAFYKSWYAARASYPGTKEQDVFEQVKHVLPGRHGLLLQFVDTAYLTGFCELSMDFNKVCTVHANCLGGLKTKLEKLTEVLDDWKKFRVMAGLRRSSTNAITE